MVLCLELGGRNDKRNKSHLLKSADLGQTGGVDKKLRLPLPVWFALLAGPWIIAVFYFAVIPAIASDRAKEKSNWIFDRVSEAVLDHRFPLELNHEKEAYTVEYTLEWNLQREAEKLLSSYRPDYAALVIMSADTGKIRALTSYEREPGKGGNLALRATFPAASLFKIVTAAAAVDRRNTDPEDVIRFNGGSHTLYKRNVFSEKINRWTRSVTLREAFGRSFNTAFSRLAFERLEPQDLVDYATRFGFNREIEGDFRFETGVASIPNEKSFELAEIASGYNRMTTMSPVHGALIAASVANEGGLPAPIIVERVVDGGGDTVLQASPRIESQVLTQAGVERMKVLMEETVRRGTSRKSFRQVRRDRKLKDLEIGGKTGSLQGSSPKGKTDWFVGYAKSESGEQLAIAAVTVHADVWRVKSSTLAHEILRRYFKQKPHWMARHSIGTEEP